MAATAQQLAALKKARAARKRNLAKKKAPAKRKAAPKRKTRAKTTSKKVSPQYVIKVWTTRGQSGYLKSIGVSKPTFDTDLGKAKKFTLSDARLVAPLLKHVTGIKRASTEKIIKKN